MRPFTTLTSLAVPLIRQNIDTDAIIPSREMKGVGKSGLADGLFAGWRYIAVDSRVQREDFILNDPAYADAGILLAGGNFGCGSSREHAAWALAEYGFRVIIAASFNVIFRGNCVRNGIVPIEADAHRLVSAMPLTVDLAAQTVTTAEGHVTQFAIDEESKAMLLGGLDEIELTLQHRERIAAFRTQAAKARPWTVL